MSYWGGVELRVITLYMDDGIYRGLRKEAAGKGRTVEEEASQIISGSIETLPPDDGEPRTGKDLYEAIRAIYAEIGFRDLEEEPPSLTPCCCPCHDHR